jgi:hypothetical protein
MQMVASRLAEGEGVLRRRLATDGFLLFRDVIAASVIGELQVAARRAAAAAGLGSSGRCADDLETALGESVHRLRSSVEFRRARTAPSLRPLLRAIGAGGPHPALHASYARFVPPARLRGDDGETGKMPAHQDHHYVPRPARFLTLWVPIVMPRAAGGIAVAGGSHTAGPVEHVAGRVAQCPTAWHVASYAPGDVVVLDAFTIHKSLGNRSQSLRVSADFRYLLATRCRRSGGT